MTRVGSLKPNNIFATSCKRTRATRALCSAWRESLQRQLMHFDIYCEVVARWNAHVAASGAGGRAVKYDPSVTAFVVFALFVLSVLALSFWLGANSAM